MHKFLQTILHSFSGNITVMEGFVWRKGSIKMPLKGENND